MCTLAKLHNRIHIFIAVFCVMMILTAGTSQICAADDLSDIDEPEYVVVLDPGHDSKHSGAAGYGLRENVLTMKIALLCKEELEKNENVTVYLTHDTLSCPFSADTSSECNKARCDYAASLGADIFVSIHINSSNISSKNGFEIYYPTSNYLPQFHDEGYKLAEAVAAQLKNVIGRYNGIYTRDSDENKMNDENFYPDGSRADYYNVIRNSKYNNILGIIIEHGYISNKYDATNYLTGDEALYRIAKADADGIMDYLNALELKTDVEQRRRQALENWKAGVLCFIK